LEKEVLFERVARRRFRNINTLKAREAECFKKLLHCGNIIEHTQKKIQKKMKEKIQNFSVSGLFKKINNFYVHFNY